MYRLYRKMTIFLYNLYIFLGSIFEPCYIQNRVMMNRVIKRLWCILLVNSDLGIQCQHMPEEMFSHDMININLPIWNPGWFIIFFLFYMYIRKLFFNSQNSWWGHQLIYDFITWSCKVIKVQWPHLMPCAYMLPTSCKYNGIINIITAQSLISAVSSILVVFRL